MKSALCFFAILCSVGAASAKCIPANEYIPFVGKATKPNSNGMIALGMYSRISPDGRFVLRSFSGDHLSAVTLMEIFKQPNGQKGARAYETDFDNEAFPVQGSWRFLVDIDGSHYLVKDIVTLQKDARKQFRGGITGFYTAAAEKPGASDQSIQIRTLSWPSERVGDQLEQGVGQLTNETIYVRKNPDKSYSKYDSFGPYYMCSNIQKTEGMTYSLPMISTDGTEFSALPQNPADRKVSMRVYKFGADNKSCEKSDDLNVATSKAIFGIAQNGKKAPVVFLSGSTVDNRPAYGIHLYDRDLKRTFFVGDRAKRVSADSFPGMTKDGRVVYGARWRDCEACPETLGYVITDFYQAEDVKRFKEQHPDQAKNFKQCITEEEVAKVEAEQSVLYGF